MANYKADKVNAWQRAKRVIISNEMNKIPTIQFDEEFVLQVDGNVLTKTEVGNIISSLKNPMIEFDLLNPETDQTIGKSNFQQAYVILYSVYRFLADKRDIRNIKWNEYQEVKAEFEKTMPPVAAAQKAYDIAYTAVVKADAIKNQDVPANVALIDTLNTCKSDLDAAKLLQDNAKFALTTAEKAYEEANVYFV